MLGIIETIDKRFIYLHELIPNSIFSSKLIDFYNVDSLLLPVGGVDNFLFIKDTDINLKDLLEFKKLKQIICFKRNYSLDEFAKTNQISVLNLEDDKRFMYENGLLTSEGLLQTILYDMNEESLMQQNILVLGYGYCGKAILKYFKGINSKIKVYARDSHDQKELFVKGKLWTNLKDLEHFDLIINTIPFPMIEKDELSNLKKNVRIYDISSYPYGFDSDYLKEIGVSYKIIPKIPGKMKPKTAAQVIYKSIISLV